MPRAQVASPRLLRHSPRDALLIALAAGHGLLLVAMPSAALIAFGLWWTANTVAHNFIHLPFFRSRGANAAFSLYLSLLLGLPQSVWRDRHLAHHAGRAWRLRWTRQLVAECAAVLALWIVAAAQGPAFLFGTCVAGWVGGLLLCLLQGHFEHARGTVSHYGALYNFAFFNDGYHAEHHARPGVHWTALPTIADPRAERSRWPAVLRWLELSHLNALERLALRSPALQRFMVERHAQAFRALLPTLSPTARVTIVGGGLFPRTALVLRRLMPQARLTIIDRSARHLQQARPLLDDRVDLIEASYTRDACRDADLVVVPLAFAGDRRAFYTHPPAPLTAVHDWLWRRHGEGAVVSWFLLKRINLVRQ